VHATLLTTCIKCSHSMYFLQYHW